MPRGTISSFADALQGFLQEVMALAAAPDADLDFVMQLRQMVLDRLTGGMASEELGGAGPGTQPMTMPPGGGPGELSRGPTPGPDMGSAMAELQRIQAGT